jgi:hypothetical protein
MREPREIEDEEHEQVVERVAALGVAKVPGMVCTGVPHPSRLGRRRTRVWEADATTNAVIELGGQLAAEGIEKVTIESASDYWATHLKGIPGEIAAAAAKTDTFPGERYRRIVKRRGKLKALAAVARTTLIIIWDLLAGVTEPGGGICPGPLFSHASWAGPASGRARAGGRANAG